MFCLSTSSNLHLPPTTRAHMATDSKFSQIRPDGHSPDSSGGISKWPLKPGVLVHINPMHNLNGTQISGCGDQFKRTPLKTARTNKYTRSRNKVYAGLERLKDLLGFGDQELVPNGIYHSPGGGNLTY